jgi:peptidoglycan/LPS O-acetylase OafA/YrhL
MTVRTEYELTGQDRETSTISAAADATLSYRADIDGLRAIAVLLIVFFHLGAYPPGGFIGVDIFFVISGFLITIIIVQEHGAGRFSFMAFYARRIKRILPALLVMLAVVLGAGAFLLMPGDYEVTGRSALYTATSLSNFYFLRHTGYFDAAADMMPLLHTWSLGVEEQFYLVWPAAFVFIVSIVGSSRRKLAAVVAILCLVSLAWCLYQMRSDPKDAFYLPQTRAWELGIGALLAILPRSTYSTSWAVASAAGFTGLALILWSACSLTSTSPFPGSNALAPIAGAALLVAPWRATGPVQKILALQPFTFFGRISYSLYLWHWPIVVLYRQYQLGAPLSPLESNILAAIILAAAWISWAFVEEPARRSRWSVSTSIGTGLAGASAVALAGFGIATAHGLPSRAPDSERYASGEVMWNWNCPHPRDLSGSGLPATSCILGANTSKPTGLLLGDSHAEHFAPLIDVAAREIGTSVVAFSGPRCMPLLGSTSVKRNYPELPDYNEFCAGLIKPFLEYIRTSPDLNLVVLASAWISYPPLLYRGDPNDRSDQHGLELLREAFDEFFRSLARPGLKFLVIGNVPPLMHYFNHTCLSNGGIILRFSHSPCPAEMLETPSTFRAAYFEDVRTIIRDLPSRWANVSVLIPQDFICTSRGCPNTLNGEFLYRDESHIRRNLKAETTEQLVHLLHLPEALAHAAIGP